MVRDVGSGGAALDRHVASEAIPIESRMVPVTDAVPLSGSGWIRAVVAVDPPRGHHDILPMAGQSGRGARPERTTYDGTLATTRS